MTNDNEVYLDPKTGLFKDDLLTRDMLVEGIGANDVDFGVFDANSLYDDIVTADQLAGGTIKGFTIDPESLSHGLPTQVVHPWRTVARTAIQHLSGLIVTAVVWFFTSIGIDLSEISSDLVISVSVLLTLIFSGLATRLMATNAVENFLAKWLPFIGTGVAQETGKAQPLGDAPLSAPAGEDGEPVVVVVPDVEEQL